MSSYFGSFEVGAGDEKNGFSFHWIKDKATKELNIETNTLHFNKVKNEDFCYYQCQVKKKGKVIFTTYRALFRSKYNERMQVNVIVIHNYKESDVNTTFNLVNELTFNCLRTHELLRVCVGGWGGG